MTLTPPAKPEAETQPNRAYNACPFMGLEEEPGTWLSYTNSANFCHRQGNPRPIDLDHQRKFCLTQAYPTCKVYSKYLNAPLPDAAAIAAKAKRRPVRRLWAIVAIYTTVLLVVIAATQQTINWEFWQNFNWPSQQETAPGLSTPAAITASPTIASPTIASPSPTITQIQPLTLALLTPLVESHSITPTLRPLPTASATPTYTAEPAQPTPGPNLETPFGPNQEYILHQVKTGESLGNLAAQYHTSVEVIRAINPLIEGASIWPDKVLVILPGATDPAQAIKFNAIQLQAPAYPAQLAREYLVSLDEIVFYNQLDAQARIPTGRWLIIPVPEA